MVDFTKLKEWIPKRITSRNRPREIRASLRHRDYAVTASLFIGKDLLSEIGVQKDDRVSIFFDEQNKRLIYLKKNERGEGGYSLHKPENNKSGEAEYLRIVFNCWLSPEEISEESARAQPVSYTIEDNVLIINVSFERDV